MRLIVLAVGRLRPPYADDVQHYLKLIARHARVEMIEVREEERVASRIPERAFVSLLHREGEQFDSLAFSRFLEARRQAGRDVCFVVGVGRAQPPDGEDDQAHAAILVRQWLTKTSPSGTSTSTSRPR